MLPRFLQTIDEIRALLVVTMGNQGADAGDTLTINSQGDAGLNATAPWEYWYLSEHSLTTPIMKVWVGAELGGQLKSIIQ